jgi:beta-galactosidase
MTAIAHKLDPTRPTTEALLLWDVEKKILRTDVEITAPVVNNVDILGINYGVANWDKLHKTFPDKPFVGSETATINTTRGAVVGDDSICQIPLGYDIAKGVNTWKKVAENDYCMGMFAWTGFDY